MGVVKGLFPSMEWLSVRGFLGAGFTFDTGRVPVYARIYGMAMGLLEVISALFILLKTKQLLFVVVVLIINIIGCAVAVLLGDRIAIISLVVRTIPLYFVIKEYSG